MAELKIRVGASVDRSLSVAFQPLIAQANKAASLIAAAGAKGGLATASGTKRGTDAAEKEYAKLARSAERWKQQMVRVAEKASRDEAKFAEKAAKARERSEAAVTAATEREAAKRARIHEREAKAAEANGKRLWRQGQANVSRDQDRQLAIAGRTIGGAISNGAAIGRRAAGVGIGAAKTLARGTGVQLDAETLIRQGVDLEQASVDLSNAGYMKGKSGANGQRQDPRALAAQMRATAIAAGTTSEDAMGGLQAYVAKTGDLETGRAALLDLAKLSKATGASLEDMADAAGDVGNALGDAPNKAAGISSVMSAIAAQGKEGAVEIKDLARQMAKLGAASGQFTGTREGAIAEMGALVQMTRAKGGAASATQAATSVGSFTATFAKGARLDKFDKYGVKTQAADGRNRSAGDIIIDALRATKGDSRKMGEMFADEGAKRVTRGYVSTYRDAGGGEAGLAAVRKAYDESVHAILNGAQVTDDFNAAMKTSKTQATIFNEQLAANANTMRESLLPAMQALAPAILSSTKKIADFIAKPIGAGGEAGVNVETHTKAMNASSVIRQDIEQGYAAPGDLENAGDARKELRAAIERKRKVVDEEGGVRGASGPSHAAIKSLKDMTPDELKYAGRTGDASVSKYMQDKKQLESMSSTLENLDTLLSKAMSDALGRTLNVRVVEGGKSFDMNAPVPSIGVEPPPGSPGRGP